MSDSQVQLSKHENNKKKIAKEFVTTSLLLAVTKKNIIKNYTPPIHT